MKGLQEHVKTRRINAKLFRQKEMGIGEQFRDYLIQNEMSQGTIEEYMRNVTRYYRWADKNGKGRTVKSKAATKKCILEYKKALQNDNLAATTINAKLAALNKYLDYKGMDFKIKYLKVQKKIFKETEKELNRNEYARLIKTARDENRERIALVMETLGATGMRVSELKYITLEALDRSTIEISMKSKIRTIVIPERVKKKLKEYALQNNINEGQIFITSGGKSLSRNQIWREMKALSAKAEVQKTKVYPHNIRALFARIYYEKSKDIVRLGDLLGHSSIDTTRIYLKVSASECQKQIEEMNIVA